jgi:hypothetical protein
MNFSGRTFISGKILWCTKEYTFSLWNWTLTVIETQGCASKWTQGLYIHSKNQWIRNWTRKITDTHKKCWCTVCCLVSKFLNSIYWFSRLNRWEVIEPQDTLVPYINSHNPYERFTFKDSYAYLNSGYTQWEWNTGYSKNFYKDPRN